MHQETFPWSERRNPLDGGGDLSLSGTLRPSEHLELSQTVLYAGYEGERAYTAVTGDLEPARRELFLKLSYAWQH